MGKKICIMIVLLSVILTSGCAGLESKSKKAELGDNKVPAGAKTVGTHWNKYQWDYQTVDNFSNDYQQLMKNCSETFNIEYPLEEDFFLWFYGKYGKKIWNYLCNQVTSFTSENWYKLTGKSIHVLWLDYCKERGLTVEDADGIYYKETQAKTGAVLDFSGDVNMDNHVANMEYMYLQPNGMKDCLSKELLSEVTQADLFLINNEFTYTKSDEGLPGKGYHFKTDPDRVKFLKDWGVDIVSLANNHVYDYGEKGLLDTLAALKSIKMPQVGAGHNIEEAKKPKYFVINGRKIAIVAATQIERTLSFTKEATQESPGVLKTLKPDKFISEITKARAVSDYVIAYVHWGTEGQPHFEKDQQKLGKAYIDAGADVVVGAHTHCLQGIEFYDDKPIIYSLGNFWFDWDEEHADLNGLAQVEIDENGKLFYRFLPCIYGSGVTRLITEPEEKAQAISYMISLSKGVRIDEDGWITQEDKK